MYDLIHILDLFGTVVFSVTGALAAGRKRMDVFGVVTLGCVTALGGGSLRDMMLGLQPVFWISNCQYLTAAALAAMGAYLLARRWRLPAGGLVYLDAVGLAVFTIIGFERGYQATDNLGVAVVMGVITGVVGGMIRDVLSGEAPLILRREIYASASLCGAVLYAALVYFRLPSSFYIPAALATTLGIRLIALRWNLALPILSLKEKR